MAGRPPELTPVYEQARAVRRVYGSVWFSRDLPAADDLAGRLHRAAAAVYWRGFRARAAARPAEPRPAPGVTPLRADEDARRGPRRGPRAVLRKRSYRVADRRRAARRRPSAATCARPATCSSTSRCWSCWSASPYGQLFGYKGGVIVVVGQRLLQLAEPVRRLRARLAVRPRTDLTPFSFNVDDFDVKFLPAGPADGTAGVLRRRPHLPDPPGRRAAAATTSRSTTR